MIETINANCLDVLKETAANSQDLIFCDPPYALGSDVIIRKDGKPDYRKAVDFMAKWQQPDGYFWEMVCGGIPSAKVRRSRCYVWNG